MFDCMYDLEYSVQNRISIKILFHLSFIYFYFSLDFRLIIQCLLKITGFIEYINMNCYQN